MIRKGLRLFFLALLAATIVLATVSYFTELPFYYQSRDRYCLRWIVDHGCLKWSYDGGPDVLALHNASYSYPLVTYEANNSMGWEYINASMSLWLLTGLLAVYPATAVLRHVLRQRRRRRLGLCLACGYDMKGTVSGICPECGKSANDVPQA